MFHAAGPDFLFYTDRPSVITNKRLIINFYNCPFSWCKKKVRRFVDGCKYLLNVLFFMIHLRLGSILNISVNRAQLKADRVPIYYLLNRVRQYDTCSSDWCMLRHKFVFYFVVKRAESQFVIRSTSFIYLIIKIQLSERFPEPFLIIIKNKINHRL